MHSPLSSFVAAAVLVFAGSGAASAQEFAARHSFSVTAGAANFDLSGTGTTLGIGIRATRALTPHVALESGLLFARPDLQGGRATLILPEAHLQYHWRFGSVAPYAGGGLGFAHQSREGSASATNLALSAAGGARAYLNDRMAVLGEFRLRGIERDFSGTIAEFMGGMSFTFGR
jgi:hypothetical protein